MIVVVLFVRGKTLPVRGTVEEKRLPLSPRPVRVWQHAVIWSLVVIAAAFTFQDSGPRTVFALALTTSLVAMIIMLSMVVITGYVGQISLAQMSLAGVAAFFTARMMANGSTTSTNPFPVSGPGLPWPIAVAVRHRRGDHRRRAARPAGGAHPRRAAGRGDAGVRHLAADAVPRERLAHRR